LNCLAGADATFSGGTETLNYTVSTAGTYYLILDSYGASANWTLNGMFDCGPVAVETQAWGNVKKLFR
jgi:hypothetical protein